MSEWKKTQDELPKLGEVVECLGPKNWIYSKLGRDYFALVEVNSELIWVSPSLTDMDYKEMEIKYWRSIKPDPNGKKPFVKIKKYKTYWEPKVLFMKVYNE